MVKHDADALTEEIVEYFGALDDVVLAECLAVCRDFDLPPESLYYKWEAKTFNAGSANAKSALTSTRPTFDLNAAHDLRTTIQRENAQLALERKAKAEILNTGTSVAKLGMRSRFVRGAAARNNVASAIAVGQPVKKENDSGGTSSWVDYGRFSRPSAIPNATVTFDGPSIQSSKTRHYRYMYETVLERSTALDAQLSKFEDIVSRHYDIQLSNPAELTEDDVYTVGRITFDAESGPTSSSKLNEASLTLEVSREIGSGDRIPLRFLPDLKIRLEGHNAVRGSNGIGSFGLFPGAIVALKGRNGGGGSFVVCEILTLPPLPPNTLHKDASHGGYTMAVACGPYTSDADLKYIPLRNFFTSIRGKKPDVVLLLGPFVDASHLALKSGETERTPTELFAIHFADPIRDFLDGNPRTMVVVVPSVRDLLGKHAVFPQAPLDESLLVDSRVKFLPNPCRFSLNGINFATTSTDTLFHLRKEELIKRGDEVSQTGDPLPKAEDGTAGSDVMANTCRHLLHQRSFYPLFPVPFDLTHELNLDVTHSRLLALDADGEGEATSPDILILPSRLKQFGKRLDENTVAVNPSFVSKSLYALLDVESGGRSVHVNTVRLDE